MIPKIPEITKTQKYQYSSQTEKKNNDIAI
jgi:hypothetical protein